MIENFNNPHAHDTPFYIPEEDPQSRSITAGLAVRVQVTRKRPRWEVVRIVIDADTRAEDLARPIDEIVDVTEFTVTSDRGPVLLIRRRVDDALPGKVLDEGEWPDLIDDPGEAASLARETLPVVYGPETFWNIFSHLDGRPELAGFGDFQDEDRMGLSPGMRLDASGIAGLRNVLRSLLPAQVRAFHEGLAYYLHQADRPERKGQTSPPRAADLRDDPTVLRRIGLLVGGPVAVREVPLTDVILSEDEENAAIAVLDIAGEVLDEGPSRHWKTVFDPFTGSNPSWGECEEPDEGSYSTVVYDPEPWGPFVVNSSLLLHDEKTGFGLRLFVRTGSGFDELTLLVREKTRRRAAEQSLFFLPSLIGPLDLSDVRAGEIYDSRWVTIEDSQVAFARSLRDPNESATAFDVP